MGPTECSVQKGKGSSRWEYRRANISRRHGFTLVELLVVIVIIGILAAIITPVAFNALGNARNAAISLELSKLSAALEAYKNEYGSYPPDMTNRLACGSTSEPTFSTACRSVTKALTDQLSVDFTFSLALL